MILTCPKCQSQYNLDPAKLGAAGRDVRCVSCGNMWFQAAEEGKPAPVMAEALPVAASAPPPETAAKSIADTLNSILEKDDAAFEAVLSSVAKNVGKVEAAPPASVPETSAAVTPMPAPAEKRAVVRQETVLPVVTHNPLGMGATAFGAMVFLFCAFLTLAPLFAAKGPVVRHWPAMSLLYRTMGFDVTAPGEGLRISEITAEKRIDSKSKVLVVEGKMTNMSSRTVPYPPLHVTLTNEKNKTVKEWDLKPGITDIASGDIVPLMLQLEDVPDDGATVELRVKEK